MQGKKERTKNDAPRVQRILRIVLRILLGLAAILLILLVVLKYESLTPEALRRAIGRRTVEERTVGYSDRISFAAGSLNVYAAADGGFSILSPSGLELLDGTGDQVLAVSKAFSRPALRTSGRYLIAYDVGGTGFVLAGEGETLQNTAAEGTLIAADVCPAGNYALVAEEASVRGTVGVYTSAGEPVYKYFSSERFLVDCALDETGTLVAVAGVRQNDARILSSVMLLTVTSETPLAVWETNDELVLSVRFLSDGSILAVTETRAVFLDQNGAFVAEYSCGAPGVAQARVGDGFVVVRPGAAGKGHESAHLVVLDNQGALQEDMTVSGLLDIDAQGSTIGLLTNEALLVYNQHLERIAQRSLVTSCRNLLLGEGNAVFTISSDAADIYLY